ncbi:MAG TPA: glycoside hydrolase family 76 protein [Mucilaginibacter sp.]|jgi:predicted alpha-1,6-mannanase (GH76 family)
MRKLVPMPLILLSFIGISCGKEKGVISQQQMNANETINFTAADADEAYKAFNTYFYDPTAKLYYSTTKQDGPGAIWTQAIYWDMAMDVYERTKNASQLTMINDIYTGGFNQYDGYNWDNSTKWFIYDDMMWWVAALARANQLTGNAIYLQKSIEGFNHVWAGSYDPDKGGMFWDFSHSGKNACINYPTVIAAVRLYQITDDESYLSKAKSIYSWAKANLFNAVNGRIADHKIGDNPPGYEDYTYNQGTAIGAAVMLYKVTNDTSYLADAKLVADYTRNNMCPNVLLPAEGDFNEQGVLKAIFAQYIMMLVKDGGQSQYLPWLQQNINAGWQNRDRSRNLTYRNYGVACPIGDIQSYEASSIVTFMQVDPPLN